jgi:thymidylate synthase
MEDQRSPSWELAVFHVFEAETANEVWRKISVRLRDEGVTQQSRAGPTREILRAAIGVRDPRQRWVVARVPALNPAFAIAEVVWLLTGRDDAAFLNYFNRGLPTFAGDGPIYHGAYGHRIRRRLHFDQLDRAHQVLHNTPESRQVVLQIWDGDVDMPDASGRPRAADIPCNVLTLLKVRSGRLELTEIVRSNDAFRGLPYNFIQFTTLQEVLAGWLGVDVGGYAQLSDSLHLYERDAAALSTEDDDPAAPNTDTLALPRAESERALRTLSDAIERIIVPETSAESLLRLPQTVALPNGYMNLLRVLCAEGVRRRGAPALATEMMARCNNPALEQVWRRWFDRVTSDPLTRERTQTSTAPGVRRIAGASWS